MLSLLKKPLFSLRKLYILVVKIIKQYGNSYRRNVDSMKKISHHSQSQRSQSCGHSWIYTHLSRLFIHAYSILTQAEILFLSFYLVFTTLGPNQTNNTVTWLLNNTPSPCICAEKHSSSLLFNNCLRFHCIYYFLKVSSLRFSPDQ